MLVRLGTEPLESGVNILGAHIDSPRLDVKQNPIEEKNEIATLDTRYYGGIKKYQWVTLPLAIHGVVALESGATVPVSIGEDEDDPVFCISDLLPHLDREQMDKKASDFIDGELLDVIVGNRPIAAEGLEGCASDKDAVKAGILAIVREALGIDEEDLLSAELEIVPAGAARDLGLDRSMILGYGHDQVRGLRRRRPCQGRRRELLHPEGHRHRVPRVPGGQPRRVRHPLGPHQGDRQHLRGVR